jgi:putative membrane protein
MTILTLVRTELRRLTSSRMGILALVALMCVPIIYAGLYLWANNDPYGNLKDVPVGLVVEDTGATTTDADGTESKVNYGDEVHDQLVKDNSVHWIDATAAQAKKGVSDGTFDFVLTLGGDFSADLTSPTSDAPRQASVQLTTNDTNSFLATTIAGNVAEKVRASIAEKVGKEAALKFLEGFADVGTSIQKATDGSNQLATGTTSAADGASKLSAGAASANDGAQQLASGADQLNSGAGDLDSGLQQLADGTSSLPADTAALNDGAQEVAAGNEALATKGGEAAADANDIASQVPQARADIKGTLDGLVKAGRMTPAEEADILAKLDPVGQKVVDANTQIQAVNTQLTALASGSRQVADGTAKLAASAPTLADGVTKAANGASALSSGAQQLADGSAELAAGTPAPVASAADLQTGILKLDSGAKELSTGLSNGLGKLPIETADEREKTASIIGDPAVIDTSAVTKASTYGAGMAPFFISLAAWIGIYALFLIIKPLSKRALTALRKPARVTAAGWLTPGILGGIQMLAVFGIVTLALGYSVANPWGMLGFMVVMSLTYATIILALNIWLGSVGQFLGLVLMVLQLVTAGGTFPWQTLPGPLAVLHHALPMGYAVDGIRQLMYGGNSALALGDAAVLLAFLAGALALSWLGARRMTRSRTLRDLRPSLIG